MFEWNLERTLLRYSYGRELVYPNRDFANQERCREYASSPYQKHQPIHLDSGWHAESQL